MTADRLNRITIDEGKCGGRPCIRGRRIRVTDVLELLANGASFEEILADYSFLERETSSPPLSTPRIKPTIQSCKSREVSTRSCSETCEATGEVFPPATPSLVAIPN